MNKSSGEGVILAILGVLVILLLFGAGATVIWQRQRSIAAMQEAAMQRERAVMEVERARAIAAQLQTSDSGGTAAPMGEGDRSVEEAIRGVLLAQQTAWNNGDVETFMESYWKSENLTFSSSGKLTRSWQATLDNYKTRYPSRSDMGTLTFAGLEVTLLGDEAALVLGDWQLAREGGDLGGKFSLVFRYLDEAWVIVHDHTSRSQTETSVP
jgi:ketosteroid isomerase-like protein